jgi:hypothetical protein
MTSWYLFSYFSSLTIPIPNPSQPTPTALISSPHITPPSALSPTGRPRPIIMNTNSFDFFPSKIRTAYVSILRCNSDPYASSSGGAKLLYKQSLGSRSGSARDAPSDERAGDEVSYPRDYL